MIVHYLKVENIVKIIVFLVTTNTSVKRPHIIKLMTLKGNNFRFKGNKNSKRKLGFYCLITSIYYLCVISD